MITREQAEQAFREFSESFTITYEMRNPQFEAVNANDIGSRGLPVADYDRTTDLEEGAWLCTYERKYKAHEGEWNWYRTTCYIVEPKPGPFVIE